MYGELNVVLSEQGTPGFLVLFFCRLDFYVYFFTIGFKHFDSAYAYNILPEISLANIVEMSVVNIRPMESAILVYRKVGDFLNFYSRTISLPILQLHSEKTIKTEVELLIGPNEKLSCHKRSIGDQIDCIMTIEGDEFTEIIFNLETANANLGSKIVSRKPQNSKVSQEYPDYVLSVNTTKIYNHYLNSVCEAIHFSEQFIILQTFVPFTPSLLDSHRYMMVYDRTTFNSFLYRGIDCHDYSNSCGGPVNIVVGSGRDFYVAAESDDYLVLNFTFLPRVLMLAPEATFRIGNASQWSLSFMNNFDPKEEIRVRLDQVINFSEIPTHKNLKFLWLPGTLFLLPFLLIGLYALVREQNTIKKKRDYQPREEDRYRSLRSNSMPRVRADESIPSIFNNISLMDKSRQREDVERFHHEVEENNRIKASEKEDTMSEGSAH